MNKQLFIIAALLGAFADVSANGMSFPINTIRFYDLRYWQYQNDSCVDVGTYYVDYYDIQGRNVEAEPCNVMQIWSADQNVLSMVKGFRPTTIQGQVAGQLNLVADDGRRGHLIPEGKLKMSEVGLGLRIHMPHDLVLGVYAPFYNIKLHDITWTNLTRDVTFGDYLVRDLITNNLEKNVAELGYGLLCEQPWHRTGFGDLVVLLHWIKDFPQPKPVLNNVLLNIRLGGSFPTGKYATLQDVMAIPFGYDGAFGLAFGGNVELTWKKYFIGAIDADFRYFFPSTHTRRIQTDPTQNDLLMLATSCSRFDQGFVERINLYGGIRGLVSGFNIDLGYQYWMQATSSITLYDDAITQFYVSEYANTAQKLQEWSLHQFWIVANYTYQPKVFPGIAPTFSFIWNKNFKGRQAILTHQAGFSVSLAY